MIPKCFTKVMYAIFTFTKNYFGRLQAIGWLEPDLAERTFRNATSGFERMLRDPAVARRQLHETGLRTYTNSGYC